MRHRQKAHDFSERDACTRRRQQAHDFSERDACARLENKLTISVSGTVNKNERQARCLKHARYTYGKRNLAAARGR